jgi:hypothetical protein
LAPKIKSITLLVLRAIWIEHNNRMFKDKAKPCAKVLDGIIDMAEARKLMDFCE